jgi:cation:H+ antiporter
LKLLLHGADGYRRRSRQRWSGETFGHTRLTRPGERRACAIGFRSSGPESSMLVTTLLFLLSAGAIYLACEYFVNGIEWLGQKLNLGATATGTVLAAFGTALPESAVTFVAVIMGRTPEVRDIGVGAALGGPLVLATIAYAVVGVALWIHRRRLGRTDMRVRVDESRLARDQFWFLSIFIVKCALGLIAFAFKPWLGVLFLLAYAFYVWRELSHEDDASADELLEPLKFQPRAVTPSLYIALVQTTLALAVIAYASHVFVSQIETIGIAMHMPPHLIALVLSPVATELPETMNALIWVRQGKERLALANISGAMMIQATVPSALALFATPWMFDTPLIVAGVVTAAAIVYLGWLFHRGGVDARKLMPVGLLYGLFAAYICGHLLA